MGRWEMLVKKWGNREWLKTGDIGEGSLCRGFAQTPPIDPPLATLDPPCQGGFRLNLMPMPPLRSTSPARRVSKVESTSTLHFLTNPFFDPFFFFFNTP